MPGRQVIFGLFEADLDTLELRKNGIRLPLQEQPLQVLCALLERPGELVTREQLRQRLWTGDTFVDFDHSLNVAVNKVREVLGDSASEPRYVETVPRRGYRFIGEIRTGGPEQATREDSRGTLSNRRFTLWKIGVAAGVGLVMALGAMVAFRGRTEPGLVVIPLSVEPGWEQEPSLSPDGSHVAYVGDPDGRLDYHVYTRPVGVGRPRRLTTASGLELAPCWSPDGRFIAFVRYDRKDTAQVILIPAVGGPERVLGSLPMTTPTFLQWRRLLSWFPDGKRLVYVENRKGRSALGLLKTESGEQEPLFDPPQSLRDADPAVAPDGRRLVFARIDGASRSSRLLQVELTAAGSAAGEPRELTAEVPINFHPAWTPDGKEIIYVSGALFRQLHRVSVGGGAPRLLPVSGGLHLGWPAVAAARLAYSSSQFDVNLWRTPLKDGVASGPAEKVTDSAYLDHMPEFSPDGRRLAFVSDQSGFEELWVGGPHGESPLRLTDFGNRGVGRVVWSPGGDYVGLNAAGEFFSLRLNGGAPIQFFPRGARDGFWSHDGSSILISDKGAGDRISRVALRDGRAASAPVALTQQRGLSPRESPDGKWIYFIRDGEHASLWRLPSAGGPESIVVESLVNPAAWTVTKQGIWFIPPSTGGASIQIRDPVTGHTKNVAPVARMPMWGLTACPDGSCVVHAQADRAESDLMMVDRFR